MPAVLHHVRPEPGVTEIRVHGVGGSSPESLLEQTGVRQVSGDDKAGMFRAAVEPSGRTVEAYSWGGLTARSRSRAFWVVLLPFSLVNVAGWMVEPSREGTLERTAGTKWHEACVQVVGVLTTAAYVMATALLWMNTIALQCGSIEQCRDRWFLGVFGSELALDHPGRRVLIGLLAPLALLATFWGLSVVSSRRYDDYGKRVKDLVTAPDEAGQSVIGLPDFWYPSAWQRHVARLHVAAPLLVLAALLARSTVAFEDKYRVEVVPDPVAYAVAVVALLALVALVTALVAATWNGGDRLLLAAGRWFGPVTRWLLGLAAVALVVACWLTSRLVIDDGRLVTTLFVRGSFSGFRGNAAAWDLWGFGWAPVLLLTLAAAFIGLFSVVQLWRWFAWRMLLLDQFVVVLMLALVMLWEWAVPVALVAAAVAMSFQWGPRLLARFRPASVGDEALELWRLWLFLAVCAVAVVTRLATGSAQAPFGPDWPRLTPVLLFIAVLTLMIAVSTATAVSMSARRVAATVAVPVGVLALGVLGASLSGRALWVVGAAWLAWVALAVVWLGQFRFGRMERRWRWNGPAAVATIALALLLGVYSGVLMRMVDTLQGDGSTFVLRQTKFYEWTALGFAGVVLVLALGAVIWFVALRTGLVVAADGKRVPRVETVCEAVRAVDVVVTMAALLFVASIVALVPHLAARKGPSQRPVGVAKWINEGTPEAWAGAVRGASWVAVGVAVLMLVAIRRGLRDSGFRARVGILWDLVTFWPRTFHPFAPPAYATRAVPEIQARLAEVATCTQPDGRAGAAILSGHSQGSVLSLAAVASLKPDVRRRVALVTHGSPLERFYRRYFPRYFPPALFDHCAVSLGWNAAAGDGAWLNFWRRSDPICDPAFDDGRSVARTPGMPPEPVRATLRASDSGVATLPDVRLADPLPPDPNPYALPGTGVPRRHSGYMADPAMWRTIDALASVLLADVVDAGAAGRQKAASRG